MKNQIIMETQPIGLVISKLIKEKRISKTELANKLNISRQAIYNLATRDSLTLEEIEQWARAIGVTAQDIIDNSKQSVNIHVDTVKTEDNYLMRYIVQLEEMVQILKGQLSEKDKQINVLLGKSASVYAAGFVHIFFLFSMYKFMYTY